MGEGCASRQGYLKLGRRDHVVGWGPHMGLRLASRQRQWHMAQRLLKPRHRKARIKAHLTFFHGVLATATQATLAALSLASST